jgi:hypothetical protein
MWGLTEDDGPAVACQVGLNVRSDLGDERLHLVLPRRVVGAELHPRPQPHRQPSVAPLGAHEGADAQVDEQTGVGSGL